jgi:AhpD family alkylhydroperoxidase
MNMLSSEKQKIEDIKRIRKNAHGYFLERSEVYRKFLELETAAFKDGALSKREKELIAIGISIVNNCEGCLEWHIREALEAAATEAQIIEAIGVAIEMGVGPTSVSSRFAAAVLEYNTNPQTSS